MTNRDDHEETKKAIIRAFIERMRIMAGTGNGIGKSTVEKVRQFAIQHGYLDPPEQSAWTRKC